jgi:hypothetical protein
MIPLDADIVEVERRIALRRERLKMRAREAGARARQALASPAALIGVAVVGFVAARALATRQQRPPQPGRRKSDNLKTARATRIAGAILPAAMWFVRAQWGSPARAAQALFEKSNMRKTATSPRGDMTRT